MRITVTGHGMVCEMCGAASTPAARYYATPLALWRAGSMEYLETAPEDACVPILCEPCETRRLYRQWARILTEADRTARRG